MKYLCPKCGYHEDREPGLVLICPNCDPSETMHEAQDICLIEPKSVYGTTYYYPANSIASTFCRLCRTKTLNKETLELIKQLGFTIEVKQVSL